MIFKGITGEQYEVMVDLDHDLIESDVKRKLSYKSEYYPDEIRLLCNGKCLFEERTLSDFGVREDNIIHFVLRLRERKPN